MKRLKYWYLTRSSGVRGAVIAFAVAVCLVAVGAIGYVLMVPHKVEVRYGTIIRDPVDGRVWEDNTRRAWVDADKAGDYRVEYIDRLSPEHEQQKAEEKAQESQQQAQVQKGIVIEPASPLITEDQLQNMRNLQQNIDVVGKSVLDGIKMLNKLADVKTQLVGYRNQIATTPVDPGFEPMKQQILMAFDKYIQACDLYIQAIVTGNMGLARQANALVSEGNAIIQSVIPGAEEFEEVIDELIDILREIIPAP